MKFDNLDIWDIALNYPGSDIITDYFLGAQKITPPIILSDGELF